ncbi:phage capsid protein [Vibrio genomosp. F10 str. ZF-129]|uniref:Phage capsid protein n=1 Tax=Vibrio genomosp. F10 str. ZF-129 TaxID=1187848 RepID=A0A1E5BA86_9VIBR|nr:GPO family capsid scaffolding protein [Vibrio genomosp. F10]OEE30731.1 phage capsid protein [Vibrio genomosp. F10 str. ZF-129]
MFKSEPICILKAGPTIDGRDTPQKVIDDIAETYDPLKYTARINEDHSDWSWKGGSVLSVEKRDDELWAEIKPNSFLLRNIENGQLLHTSCEYLEDFANTGKAYLTGLAFTDKPASLGTTQVHLSAQRSEEKAIHVSTGLTLNETEQLSKKGESTQERSLLTKLYNLLKLAPGEQEEQLSKQEESETMSKETEELLKQSVEQNKELNSNLSLLITKLSKNGDSNEGEEGQTDETEGSKEVTELKGQVETLSTQVGELSGQLEKFSKLTDEEQRQLAGEGGEADTYL